LLEQYSQMDSSSPLVPIILNVFTLLNHPLHLIDVKRPSTQHHPGDLPANHTGLCSDLPSSPLMDLPAEILSLTLSFLSIGSLQKLSTVSKALQPLSHLSFEEAPSPLQRLQVSRAMLARLDQSSYSYEVRFNPRRAYSVLRDLSTTCSSPVIKIEAIVTLAQSHLESISCSIHATREARLHGVSLMSQAFDVATSSPPSSLTTTAPLLIKAGRDLSELYETGSRALPHSLASSSAWLERCASLGDVESMVDYGLCCELGHGLEEPNLKEAFEWYKRAASSKLSDPQSVSSRGEACYSVGDYYEFGKGGAKLNHTEAVMWYKRGMIDGDEDCEKGHTRLGQIAMIIGNSVFEEGS